MRKLFYVAAVIGIIATACSTSGGDADDQVRPFEEIQGSDLSFENDPDFPGRAIFRVETTEPAICAIVWGETEALGHFNNSLNMNGTGIIQHDVFLPGAEAGQTYFYRLQGSTADGTIFQSDLMTFTLPTQATGGSSEASTAPNLATEGTIAAVSSEFSASWAASNAIDGDLSTEWSSSGEGDDSFITIDLGAVQRIGGFEFITRSMADGTAVTIDYSVTVDDSETLGPFPAGTPAAASTAAVDTEGQIFRFDVSDSTGGNTGAIEIRILAP